jgi:hypothetical protein
MKAGDTLLFLLSVNLMWLCSVAQAEVEMEFEKTPATEQSDALQRLKANDSHRKVVISKKPDLSGSWVLNTDLSEDPGEKIQAAVKKARNSQTMRNAGRGRPDDVSGGGGRRGGFGGFMSSLFGGRDRVSSATQGLFGTSETLLIKHKDPVLQVTTANGRKRTVHTDNRGSSISAIGGDVDQKIFTAGWESKMLVIESTSDAGPDVYEEFKLLDEGQLSVHMYLQLPMMSEPVAIHRVYQLADAL